MFNSGIVIFENYLKCHHLRFRGPSGPSNKLVLNSMYGIFTYIWLKFIGTYSIHGASGIYFINNSRVDLYLSKWSLLDFQGFTLRVILFQKFPKGAADASRYTLQRPIEYPESDTGPTQKPSNGPTLLKHGIMEIANFCFFQTWCNMLLVILGEFPYYIKLYLLLSL